jgi:ABC-type dipeptide/oligopeptide/nickel transport system permease subunit
MMGAAVTGVLLMTAALSQVYTPKDPLAMSIAGRLAGPSWDHPFGTDQYGRHILPNTVPPLIIQATTAFPVAILAEAGLAYLGLGTQPPYPSWGLMLKEAQNFLSLSPSYAVFPGGAIALTVLGLNLLGDGLRDLLDPSTI